MPDPHPGSPYWDRREPVDQADETSSSRETNTKLGPPDADPETEEIHQCED